jgi:hypothetical protein
MIRSSAIQFCLSRLLFRLRRAVKQMMIDFPVTNTGRQVFVKLSYLLRY